MTGLYMLDKFGVASAATKEIRPRDQKIRPESDPFFMRNQTYIRPSRLYRATSLARVGPTAAAAEAVVATPVKPVIYLMKNQFHRENLQISGVPD